MNIEKMSLEELKSHHRELMDKQIRAIANPHFGSKSKYKEQVELNTIIRDSAMELRRIRNLMAEKHNLRFAADESEWKLI